MVRLVLLGLLLYWSLLRHHFATACPSHASHHLLHSSLALASVSSSLFLTGRVASLGPYPNRLPKPKLFAGPLLLPRVALPLPPSSSMSIASSLPKPPRPRLPVAFSSLVCMIASSALSFFRRTFSLSTASFLTFSTCASRSARAESQRCDHACSVDCRAGSEPGARSRSGATDVTEMSECAGSRVAVMRPE